MNLSDLSKMLVKKQMKHFDVPLDHAWKVPILQELLNTRMNNLYVEGFDNYMITEMINMLVMIHVTYLCIIFHIYLSFFF